MTTCQGSQQSLVATCPAGSVVTANVYGSVEHLEDGCVYNGSQCLSEQQGQESPALCLWKKSSCTFPEAGTILRPPEGCPLGPTAYMVALDVKCVPGKSPHHVFRYYVLHDACRILMAVF